MIHSMKVISLIALDTQNTDQKLNANMAEGQANVLDWALRISHLQHIVLESKIVGNKQSIPFCYGCQGNSNFACAANGPHPAVLTR